MAASLLEIEMLWQQTAVRPGPLQTMQHPLSLPDNICVGPSIRVVPEAPPALPVHLDGRNRHQA